MSKVIGIGAGLVFVAGLAAAVTMPSRTLRHISSDEAAMLCKSGMVNRTEQSQRDLLGGVYRYFQCYGSQEKIPAYQ